MISFVSNDTFGIYEALNILFLSYLVPHRVVCVELGGTGVVGHCCLCEEMCSPVTHCICLLYLLQCLCMIWVWFKTNSTYVFQIIPIVLEEKPFTVIFGNAMLIALTLQTYPGKLLKQEHLDTLGAGITFSLELQCSTQHLSTHDSSHPTSQVLFKRNENFLYILSHFCNMHTWKAWNVVILALYP